MMHAVFHGLQDEIKDILCNLPNSVSLSIKMGLTDAYHKLSDYYSRLCPNSYPSVDTQSHGFSQSMGSKRGCRVASVGCKYIKVTDNKI